MANDEGDKTSWGKVIPAPDTAAASRLPPKEPPGASKVIGNTKQEILEVKGTAEPPPVDPDD